MIIYIHGFGSSGQGEKSCAFRQYFKKNKIPFIAPSLSVIPELALSTLEELIESYENVVLIGSSLGGYYALYLSSKYNIKCVLINPSIYPYTTLREELPQTINFYDDKEYSYHIEKLKSYEVNHLEEQNIFLLLQKGDTVLDYREALKKMPKVKTILEEKGNHRFDGIERYFDEIHHFILY